MLSRGRRSRITLRWKPAGLLVSTCRHTTHVPPALLASTPTLAPRTWYHLEHQMKTVRKPCKPRHLTRMANIAGKAYTAPGQAASALHTMAVLQVFQGMFCILVRDHPRHSARHLDCAQPLPLGHGKSRSLRSDPRSIVLPVTPSLNGRVPGHRESRPQKCSCVPDGPGRKKNLQFSTEDEPASKSIVCRPPAPGMRTYDYEFARSVPRREVTTVEKFSKSTWPDDSSLGGMLPGYAPLQLWLKACIPAHAWHSGSMRVQVTHKCLEAMSPWMSDALYRQGVMMRQSISCCTAISPGAESTEGSG
ncbi:hypothetical protein G5714_010279 [Onychostoma macrolepis]|uniref:Uncharacterized protein n=1 Tax=Onychostoma macrolepis TaxID=369639 RepID=A0A7J6CPS0_9TELE|nr:hypothetical protein G5714_010279 [Onychostoma macrolepis]